MSARAFLSTRLGALSARPGLVSAGVHGVGLAIRLAFMFAVLQFSGAELLGRFGLLASIEVVVIYLAGFEFHAFSTRRYARHPGPLGLRIALACHRRLLLVSAPIAVVSALTATLAFKLQLTILELALFAAIVAGGSIAQEMTRFIVMANGAVPAAAMGFIRSALWQPVALLFLATAEPLQAVMSAWAGASLLSVFFGAWTLRSALWSRIRPPARYLLRGVGVARRFYLMASASVIQGNLERFVLQAFLGPEAVGLFAFFQNLANALPALIQAAVTNVFLARILTSFSQRLDERFVLLKQLSRRVLTASALISTCTVAGAASLALLMSKTDYLRDIWMLPLLLLGQTLQAWSQPLYLALFGAHEDRAIMWLSLGTLAASLGWSVLFVDRLGLQGAVLSQLLAGVVILGSRQLVFRSYRRQERI